MSDIGSGAVINMDMNASGVYTACDKMAAKITAVKKEFTDLGRRAMMATAQLQATTKTAGMLTGSKGFGGMAATTTRVVGGMKDVERRSTQLNSTFDQQSKTIKKTTKASRGMLSGMVMSMVVIGGAIKLYQALKEAILSSAKAFRVFELAMAEVSTIVQDTEGWMNTLNHGVRAMSMQFGKSAEDLSRGLYDILSAAVPVKDSLELLQIATKAAAAGLTTVEKSVDVLTSVMNAYGKTVAQMYQVSDVMFKSVIRGKFRFEDLANSLGYVTPIAAQVGISFDEIAAAISSATRQGQHVDMVARGLALTIQNIIKPSKGASEAAMELGIDLSSAAIAAYGLTGFMERLATASNNNAANISKIIPNMRSYRVAMVLASGGAEEFVTDLDLMETSLGSTQTAFNKIADTIDMQRNILIQYKEEMKRMSGEGVTAIEQLGIKWEMFTTSLFSIWAAGGESTAAGGDNPLMRVLNGLSFGIGGAIAETKQASEEASKVAQQYVQDQIDILNNPPEEVTPLFERLMSGEDVDVSRFSTLDNLLKAQTSMATDIGDSLSDAYGNSDVQGSRNAIAGLTKDFQSMQGAILTTKEEMAYWQAGLDDAATAVENYARDIDTITTYMDELNVAIKEGEQKLAEMEHSIPLDYMNHWISLLQEDASYQDEMNQAVAEGSEHYEWYTDEVANAISVVHDYEKQTKEATDAQNEFNEALARNRIETMKIQLLGMMRRRGNTRAELRVLKKLSIERTEMQIEAAEKALDAEISANDEGVDSGVAAYNTAQDLINKTIRDQEHLLWTTKDTRQQDMDDLKESIDFKKDTWWDYKNKVGEIQQNMYDAQELYKGLVVALGLEEETSVKNRIKQWEALNLVIERNLELQGKDVPGKTEAFIKKDFFNNPIDSSVDPVGALNQERIRTAIPGLFNYERDSLARGTSYIPSDGMYNLHRGEQVVSSNNVRNEGASTVINVNVTGNNITKESENSIASQIADQVSKGLMDKRTGKSNYRLR